MGLEDGEHNRFKIYRFTRWKGMKLKFIRKLVQEAESQ